MKRARHDLFCRTVHVAKSLRKIARRKKTVFFKIGRRMVLRWQAARDLGCTRALYARRSLRYSGGPDADRGLGPYIAKCGDWAVDSPDLGPAKFSQRVRRQMPFKHSPRTSELAVRRPSRTPVAAGPLIPAPLQAEDVVR
jgi:hypothetical protein